MTHEEFTEAVGEELLALRDMLITKNRKYGNSALEPVRIFSKTDAVEQLKVRIDDKLSRLVRGDALIEDEDVEMDLIGYLVMLRVAKRERTAPPILTRLDMAIDPAGVGAP